MTYDLDYFIDKFERIPEGKWCVGDFTDELGRHCAFGHLLQDASDELATLTVNLDKFPNGDVYQKEYDSKEDLEKDVEALLKEHGLDPSDYKKIIEIDGERAGEA